MYRRRGYGRRSYGGYGRRGYGRRSYGRRYGVRRYGARASYRGRGNSRRYRPTARRFYYGGRTLY